MPGMGTLYLVRHGQASFGADDYDRLSDLGWRQSRRLGQWLAQHLAQHLAQQPVGSPATAQSTQDEKNTPQAPFAAVLTGTLRRHAETWQGMAEGAGGALDGLPTLALPGLNEYDSHAVIQAIHPQPLPKPDTPELYRLHFRLLRQGLAAWMAGQSAPQGMPSYAGFVQGIDDALALVRQQHAGQRVLLVSSGGPIATAVGRVLGTAPETSIELNLRIRNTALTEFVFTPKRHALLSFNTLPHLDGPDWYSWQTYA